MSFSGDIVAIIASFANRGAHDLSITTEVTYLAPGLTGLEPGDTASILDSEMILLTTEARTADDFVHVLTTTGQLIEIPMLAVLPLFGVGLFALGLRRIR